jgi:hypothetical protein
MSELKQTVTRTEERGLDPRGAAVQQETREIRTERRADAKTTAQNVVWFILGIIEVLLAVRFLLKLLGANSASGFVNFVYSVTDVLTAPFDNIFNVSESVAGRTQSVFEPSIIVAAIVYAAIAYGIVKLLNITQKN